MLKHKRVLLFAIVGVINTCVDWVVFFSLVAQFNVALLYANCIAFGTAVCISYVLNRNITFADKKNSRKNTWVNLTTYVAVALLALWGSSYILLVVSRHGSVLAGKLAGTIVSFIVNYVGSRVLVFKD